MVTKKSTRKREGPCKHGYIGKETANKNTGKVRIGDITPGKEREMVRRKLVGDRLFPEKTINPSERRKKCGGKGETSATSGPRNNVLVSKLSWERKKKNCDGGAPVTNEKIIKKKKRRRGFGQKTVLKNKVPGKRGQDKRGRKGTGGFFGGGRGSKEERRAQRWPV